MRISMIITVIFFLLVSCSRVEIPDRIYIALSQSGTNRSELISTVARFQQDADSLRLACLYYLLENSQFHNYAVIALYDSNRVEVNFSALDYDNYDRMRDALDSLEAEMGDLSWGLHTRRNDPEFLNSEFLIDNIDCALSAWQNYDWSRNYSYDLFREYILPYRGSSEPLESWRPYFQEALASKIDSLQGITDPVPIAVVVNRWLKGVFKFDPRFYCHPTDQGLSEMLDNQSGRCEDMTNLAIYALRSLGIAATSDYTPYWANSDNNHAWNALITPAGEAIPFMGAEAEPGFYQLGGKLAKVYRKTFSAQPGNLAFRINPEDKIPAWLSGKNYLDVTPFYTDVSDVTLTLEPAWIDSAKYAYLCVFNGGEWQPIHWGEIIDNQVIFSAMGTGICYLPVTYPGDEIKPASSPFLLSTDGSISNLNGESNSQNLLLLGTNPETLKMSSEKSRLTADQEYELFYWEGAWQSAGIRTAAKEGIHYENLPGNRLYWLVKVQSRRQERIFTYQQSKQIWW